MDDIPLWIVVFSLPLVALIGVHVFALADAFRIPRSRWLAAEQSKYLWLTLIWYVPGLGAVYYLARIRPTLREHDEPDSVSMAPTPG
jgi:hypothetical protein